MVVHGVVSPRLNSQRGEWPTLCPRVLVKGLKINIDAPFSYCLCIFVCEMALKFHVSEGYLLIVSCFPVLIVLALNHFPSPSEIGLVHINGVPQMLILWVIASLLIHFPLLSAFELRAVIKYISPERKEPNSVLVGGFIFSLFMFILCWDCGFWKGR